MDLAALEQAFAGLGLDFHGLFPTTSPYEAHEWLVKTIPRVGLIVNAVPPEAQFRSLPWEEWYVLEGKRHHHVLYLKKPPKYDEIFQAPDHDDVHPLCTLGRKWYVIDDPDFSPVLLRASASP
jgi:hypothetical protein